MSFRHELKRLINPRAEYLARGKAGLVNPVQIGLRLTLVLALLGLFAALLSHFLAAI